jgi:hypothetical protein
MAAELTSITRTIYRSTTITGRHSSIVGKHTTIA